jgi:hypothetical protein
MQYFPDNVAPGANASELPPSLRLEGGAGADTSEALEPGMSNFSGGGPALNAGAYLIRAVVAFENGITHKIDVSVIQNSNAKA